jgi:hypothetical protein
MISVDIETSCNGLAEFRYWRPGFKIDSIACSWRTKTGEIQSWFSNTPQGVDSMIRRLAELGIPILVHNLAFELGVFTKIYPELEFNWAADTMRLAQLDDNSGGNKFERFEIKTADDIMDELLEAEEPETQVRRSGLGLVACTSRYLPTANQNHKSVAHKWLEDNHGIKSNHGNSLHLLPYEEMKQYNIADTETTLLLYEQLTEILAMKGCDWSKDWALYVNRVKLMCNAYIRGLKIDREALKAEIYKVDAEVKEVLREFLDATVDSRRVWAAKFPGKVKSRPTKPDEFNIGSNQQLGRLFIDCMGVVGGRTTKTGLDKVESKELTPSEAAIKYPSFASKHLATWGPLGEILYKRRKLLLVLQQMLGVFLGSQEDGRLHPEVRASGTMTNRVAGGRGIE